MMEYVDENDLCQICGNEYLVSLKLMSLMASDSELFYFIIHLVITIR